MARKWEDGAPCWYLRTTFVNGTRFDWIRGDTGFGHYGYTRESQVRRAKFWAKQNWPEVRKIILMHKNTCVQVLLDREAP